MSTRIDLSPKRPCHPRLIVPVFYGWEVWGTGRFIPIDLAAQTSIYATGGLEIFLPTPQLTLLTMFRHSHALNQRKIPAEGVWFEWNDFMLFGIIEKITVATVSMFFCFVMRKEQAINFNCCYSLDGKPFEETYLIVMVRRHWTLGK